MNRKRKLRKWLRMALLMGLLLLAAMVFSYYRVHGETEKYIYDNVENVPAKPVALLLGTRVLPDGRLGRYMQQRADATLALYRSGKIKKILISGDHGHKAYDEVNTIRNYLLEKGVPVQDIFMDHAGFDTYNSMYRARDVFQVREVILVSQHFHLARAVYIARNLGLDAVALSADAERRAPSRFSYFREFPAAFKAWLQAGVFKPKPHFLGEVLPITGDGRITEDKK